MKKVIYLLPVILMSCANFHGTETSVWSGGMWILPVLTFGASAFFFFRAFQQSKGGTLDYERNKQGLWELTEDKKKIPLTKTPFFWFGAIAAVIGIGVVLAVILEA